MAPSTHSSLIAGLRGESPDAWERFNRIYRPWLLDWIKHYLQFQAEDAEDVVQQVMADLHLEFRKQHTGERAAFQHNGRDGAFRAWLRTITYHRALAFLRARRLRQPIPNAEELLAQLNDPNSGLSGLWNQQHEQKVIQQAWEAIQGEFAEKMWRPVGEVLFRQRRAREVAVEFGMSFSSYYNHERAIKARLRELLDGLMDA
jgi:RNA polymerase sigma-70 factor (ECF subfamily)